MLANQEEFVYVTWQEREKQRQAQEYLARAQRRKETIRRAREDEQQTEHLKSQAQAATQQISTMMGDYQSRRTQPEAADADERSSTYAFSQVSQRLAKPTTIPFERIQRTITILQKEFRRKKSERGSYLEHDNGGDDSDYESYMQQRARDTAAFQNGNSMLIDERR